MGALINTGNGSVISHGSLHHYRDYGLMLRNLSNGSIEHNTVYDQYDQANWVSHSLDLFSCTNSTVTSNEVHDTYNASTQTTACSSSTVIGNVCTNIQWNAYKSDGDTGTNPVQLNHWNNIGGYAIFFGGSQGMSNGTWTFDQNIWENLFDVIQPDNSEVSWKFRTASGLTTTSVINFTNNEVSDFHRVDSALPVLLSAFPGPYSVTNNTFDTVGPKNGTTPPVYGRVFQNDPTGNESGNTYINCVRF